MHRGQRVRCASTGQTPCAITGNVEHEKGNIPPRGDHPFCLVRHQCRHVKVFFAEGGSSSQRGCTLCLRCLSFERFGEHCHGKIWYACNAPGAGFGAHKKSMISAQTSSITL